MGSQRTSHKIRVSQGMFLSVDAILELVVPLDGFWWDTLIYKTLCTGKYLRKEGACCSLLEKALIGSCLYEISCSSLYLAFLHPLARTFVCTFWTRINFIWTAPLFLPSHLFHVNTVQTKLRFLHSQQQIHIKSGFFGNMFILVQKRRSGMTWILGVGSVRGSLQE